MRPERRSSGLLRVPFVQACRLSLADGRSLTGFLVNVNILGAYVAAEHGQYPVLGETLVCRFRTPENDIEMEIPATVAWVNAHQQHPVHSLPPGFGVKFETLTDTNLRRVQDVVDAYIKRHPGAR
jgi:Tfp pilus assembly protein PilZ